MENHYLDLDCDHYALEGDADMEENKIGLFIRDRRLALGLTQQQLADRLGVTDKAVSKWERSVSYPDITLLRELAAALEVGVTELLAGERDQTPPVPPEVQDAVVDAVAYAETARRKNGGWRWWTFVALTAGCLIATLVLCIVDRFRFQGSLTPIQWIAYGWAVCYPLLRTEDRPIRNALIIASVGLFVYFFYRGEFLAILIVIASSAYAWVVYWAGCHYKRDRMAALLLIVPLGVVLHLCINFLCSLQYWDFYTLLIFGAVLALDALGVLTAWAIDKFSAKRR